MIRNQRDDHRNNRDHRTDDNKFDAIFFEDCTNSAAHLHADGDKEQHQKECKEQIADNTSLKHTRCTGVAKFALLYTLCPSLSDEANHDTRKDAAGNAKRKISDFDFAQCQTERNRQKDQKELICKNRNQRCHIYSSSHME